MNSPVRSSGPGRRQHLVLADAELALEQVEHVRVDCLLDLQPDGRAEPPAHELALHSGEQVLGVVLLDLDVLVAGHPEGVVLEHLHAREELGQVRGDDVLEGDEPLLGDRQEAREVRRHLDPGEVLGGCARDSGGRRRG